MEAEIISITNHRYTSGVVEFNNEYFDGDTECHPIDLVIDVQPQMAATYVIGHNLCTTYNNRYC